MEDTSIEIPASKCFTATNLNPKNIILNTLFTGLESDKDYKGYIFFDISNWLKDFHINSIILRLYLKELKTLSLSPNLYISEVDKNICELNECSNPQTQISYTVNKDSHGSIDINIMDLFYNNNFDIIKNKLFMLSSDEKEKSLFIFSSNSTEDDKLSPKLLITCCDKQPKTIKRFMGVKEYHWTFDLYKSTVSEVVNIEDINEGTFFVTNESNYPVAAAVQVSGNLMNWITDTKVLVNPHTTNVLISRYYGKYSRLLLLCKNSAHIKASFVFQFYK
ncbi:hypothetical protein CLRAG_01940 [Clostridium ragsdalei P11]|uniref:DUF6385 domain-containing protein n=1 Tax=Clostridium ragsdalei P11 TaxID=1353534 RepID=A0A1A6B3Q7_9CLOT|nr:DUF6385 domain-containing protein [Clostridium ragsdalei]OBR96969.1 hypothetical protein CLRAG_01940 [Clostridium ragsdalei P11]